MEMESYISLGGTIFYMLSLRKKQNATLSAEKSGVLYGPWYTPLFEKGIKETQNKPMETTKGSDIKRLGNLK